MNTEQADLNVWLSRIQSEYREMPGLQLTRSQFRRLWGLDSQTCDSLIETLQSSHFLRVTSSGKYALDSVSYLEHVHD